jgi:hypothetical protein
MSGMSKRHMIETPQVQRARSLIHDDDDDDDDDDECPKLLY